MSTDILQAVTEKVLDNPNGSDLREINLAILYEIKTLRDDFHKVDNRLNNVEQKISEHEQFKTESLAYYRSVGIFSAIVSFFTTLLISAWVKTKT